MVATAAPDVWKLDGVCRQVDPELWFPDKGQSARVATRICAACPVRAECLAYALERDERFGVWGGLSERERRKLAPSRAPKSRAPHRTHPAAASRSPLVDCPCGAATCQRWVARATRNRHLRLLRAAHAAA
jgi:Transcription factor WhiB